MTKAPHPPDALPAGPTATGTGPAGTAIDDLQAAAGYIARICFKTGPPRRIGLELEWTVHYRDQPARHLDPDDLTGALGDHAPRTLRPTSPHVALPHGGLITVEPGGQVELSTPPTDSLHTLHLAASADLATLTRRLDLAGLCLGHQGCDPHRPPHQILRNRRYAAMAAAFDRQGQAGADMMCGTAGLQVCLDAGTDRQLALRWSAAHLLGPPLLALFANSPARGGRQTGWASSRMQTWLTLDPVRTAAPADHTHPPEPDPVAGWVRRVLDTPPLFVAEGPAGWRLPGPMSFGEWIVTNTPRPPTYADLDLHLSTLFPPVRPRGYLEIRYLDAQPERDWIVPATVLAALFARDETLRTAIAYAAPATDRWLPAARHGLADPIVATSAAALVELACDRFTDLDLPAETITTVTSALRRRLQLSVPGME
ncbi:glutamate-cysteine ligase family protein [Solwaraspora sp. WMMB335]|uniref:glutamate-cysteine ligase family protein n=1 Tax=Solwaraspora sp. WMMB335 TaxID=3404118 RepID=UPI003B948E40